MDNSKYTTIVDFSVVLIVVVLLFCLGLRYNIQSFFNVVGKFLGA